MSKKEKVHKALTEAWQKVRKVQKTDDSFSGILAQIESAIAEISNMEQSK